MELRPFGLFAVAFVALIAWFVMRARAGRERRLATLARLGAPTGVSKPSRALR